jgi:endonuclease/exonuclease/phosphatase family metal-dependent hydrolase
LTAASRVSAVARLLAAATVIAAGVGLAGCERAPQPVIFVTYNTQNLFDATEVGTEYDQYSEAGGWTADSYYKRLIRLGHVLGELVRPKPDIIALQEIESPQVISDLLRDFLRDGYQVAMSPDSESTIRVALISRHRLSSIRIHRSVAVALCPGASPMPAVGLWQGREMVDARIDVGHGWETIRVVVCHWKSQSGGERQTEAQRIQSAALLETLLADTPRVPDGSGRPLTLIVGDLNEDVDEYGQHGGAYPTALMVATTSDGPIAEPDPSIRVVASLAAAGLRANELTLYSPWLESDARGSYYHAGRWERLDHVLVLPGSARGVEAKLAVVNAPELVGDDGRPARYDPRTGRGYSDHLPVVVELRAATYR